MKEKLTLIILNLALISFTFWSFTLDYASISDYSFGLTGLSREFQYKDVKMKVFTSYSNFIEIACTLSKDEKILDICFYLPTIHIAGSLFLIISCIVLLLSFYAFYRSFLKTSKIFYTISPPLLYLIGSIIYFAMLKINETGNQEKKSNFSYEIGCLCVLGINFVQGLLVARHFYYRNLRNESFFKFEDSKASINTGEILLDNRVQIEEILEPTRVKLDEVDIKKLELKNTMLLEKLKIRGDINWDMLNSIKLTLDNLLNLIEEKNTKIDSSILLSIQENLKFFIDDLLNKKNQEWDLKRKSYKTKISELRSEIKDSKSSKNYENQNMRNQIFTLQAERNELMQYQEKTSTELKRLQDLAERSVSMSNFQSTNSEIIRLNQEIMKIQKSLQEKAQKLIETEQEVKELKVAEEKYKNCFRFMGKVVKGEFMETSLNGEFDIDVVKKEFVNFYERTKKSSIEFSLLESKIVELETENLMIIKELRDKEEIYNELRRLPEIVKDLKAKKKYMEKICEE